MSQRPPSSPNYSRRAKRLDIFWDAVLGYDPNVRLRRLRRHQLQNAPRGMSRRGSFFENAGYDPYRNIERRGRNPLFVPIPQATLNATRNRYTRKYKLGRGKLSAYAAPYIPRANRRTAKRTSSETKRPQVIIPNH